MMEEMVGSWQFTSILQRDLWSCVIMSRTGYRNCSKKQKHRWIAGLGLQTSYIIHEALPQDRESLQRRLAKPIASSSSLCVV
jgi:hypothetical protein